MAAMSWLVAARPVRHRRRLRSPIVREPDGRVWTVNGSGYGPDGGELGFYRDRGLDGGAADRAARRRRTRCTGRAGHPAPGGRTRALAELWAPAVRDARTGVPCTAKTRRDIAEHAVELAADADAAGGCSCPAATSRRSAPGCRSRSSRDQIELLAADPGPSTPASSPSARSRSCAPAVRRSAATSGPLAGDAPAEPAISARATATAIVHQTPMPSAGWMVLQQAAICDGMRERRTSSSARTAVHWMASAARQAFADRFARCGSDTDAWRETLTPRAVGAARAGIEAPPARTPAGMAVGGDTTSAVCVDADGPRGQLHPLAGLHVRRPRHDPGHRRSRSTTGSAAAPT